MGLPDPTDVAAYDELEQRRIGGPDPAARGWKYRQQYADAKSDVSAEIMSRAMPD